MALINLQTNLKSLTYGEFGSKDPLVTKDINRNPSPNDIELQAVKRVDDLKRVTKLLTQTPSAIYFGAHQASLNTLEQRIKSNKKGSVAGDIIRGIGNTAKVLASTIAQVPVSGTGTHFVKGFAGKMGYLPGVRGHIEYKNEIPNGLYETGSNNITTIGKVEETGNTDKKGVVLRTYVDKFQQVVTQKQYVNPNLVGGSTTTAAANPDKVKIGNDYQLLYREINKVTDKDRYNQDNIAFSKDYKVPLNVGGSTGFILKAPVDNITAQPPQSQNLDESPSSQTFYPLGEDGNPTGYINDTIDFNFKVIEPIRSDEGSPIITYLPFRAYLESFNDSFSSEWNQVNYIGRGENLYNYGGFDRQIQFSFKVAASSRQEMEPLYQKLNLLASSLAPTYVGNSFMRGNMVAITIGDYLRDQPGFISNITFDWEVDFIWHSEGMNSRSVEDTGEFEDVTEGIVFDAKELPTILNVGVSFTPIHTQAPEYGREFIGKTDNTLTQRKT